VKTINLHLFINGGEIQKKLSAWNNNVVISYVAPKKREQVLRSRAGRRARWLERKWRRSAKGNLWIKAGDYHVVIAAEIGQPGKFRGFINEKRGRFLYESEVAAQLALFDAIKQMKVIAKKRAASLN